MSQSGNAESSLLEDFALDLAASHGHSVRLAVWLSYGPDHPKVARGGAHGTRIWFEYDYFPPAARRGVGMRQPEYTGAYDGDVSIQFHVSTRARPPSPPADTGGPGY